MLRIGGLVCDVGHATNRESWKGHGGCLRWQANRKLFRPEVAISDMCSSGFLRDHGLTGRLCPEQIRNDAGQKSSSGKPHFWIVGVSRSKPEITAGDLSAVRPI